jgi:hypothetical protein
MEEGVDSGKGGCVGPYFVVYFYSVSSYRPPVPQSIHLVPLLLHHPFKVSGFFAGRMTGRRHLWVTRSFISSCSSASVHSLPCGPRIAEEKGAAALPRLGLSRREQGSTRGGRWWEPKRRRGGLEGGPKRGRGGLEGGGCGSVVVGAEGVWGWCIRWG